MLTSALYLPVGSHVEPAETLLPDGHEAIMDIVGGHFECVTAETSENEVVVGYVLDDASGAEFNYLATAMFQQPLFGPCVVVWGTDRNGVYDGHNHDVPTWFVDYTHGAFLHKVAEAYNMSAATSLLMELAIHHGHIEESEADLIMEIVGLANSGDASNKDIEFMNDRMNEMMKWAEENLNDDMIQAYLEEQNG